MSEPTEDLDQQRLVVVAERHTEIEGRVLIDVLADAGIRASVDGWHTAAFHAETPGMVQVKTFAKDARRAREIIDEIKPLGNTDTPEESSDA